MNLTTARSMDRAREIGLRKVVGAIRSQLVKQFLSESLVMSTLALVLGIVLTETFLLLLNSLYNLTLTLDYSGETSTILWLIALGIMVGIFSFVIACPVAYWTLNQWLNDFAHRTTPGIEIFVLAGLTALVITFITVSSHAVKAALTNPVEALRYE
jgi:ABC-type antimicrobial peptide transport system permease subunit